MIIATIVTTIINNNNNGNNDNNNTDNVNNVHRKSTHKDIYLLVIICTKYIETRHT